MTSIISFVTILFFVFIFISLILIVVGNKKNNAFKQTVVKEVVHDIFDVQEYNPKRGLDEKRIFATKLVDSGNSYSSSDYLKANYKGVDFEFSNVVVQHTTTTDDTTHTVTYFYGQWLIIKPKKHIKSKLYVIDKSLNSTELKRAGLFKRSDLEKVELESIGFNREYRAYANDVQEAFEVLSPQKIMELYEKHHEDVSFYLHEDELHIAIYSNKSIFSTKLFSKELEDVQQKRVQDEIIHVLSYITILD